MDPIENRYQLKSVSEIIGSAIEVLQTGRAPPAFPGTKAVWTVVYCRQTRRRAKRMYVAAYRGNDVSLTNRYGGSPVCAAAAADIPAAIFFVYETLSRPVSRSVFSSTKSALVPIFRRAYIFT